MSKSFDHHAIEKKWQAHWKESNLYSVDTRDESKEKKFILTEFPYPSGNLHIGHWYAFAVPDIYVRMLRMQGKQVLFPIGFDSFGLPAENAAIKRKLDPRKWTYDNIAHMTTQLESMGNAFDWSRKIITSDPEYYRWTQWIFLQFFKKGLAYRGVGTVNWCPSCNTVLANEQVVDGKCERCSTVVELREMPEWKMRITDYADRLIDDLEPLAWPEHIKNLQRNWIGRSRGAELSFMLSTGDDIKVFTTRPDTLYGATYVVIAPEHPLIEKLKPSIGNWNVVSKYRTEASQKSEIERLAEGKEKTGVKLEGVIATNPANGETIPVFIADYVLARYGTGAIMAVPAHDERDNDFAKKFNLPIKKVIDTNKYLIFDFDGVIGDTFEAALVAMVEMGSVPDIASAREDVLAYARNKPNHTRGHTLSDEQLKEIYDWTKVFGEEMLKREFDLFNGFIDEILKLQNTKIAIVSSGSKLYVQPALEKSRLSPTHVLAFEDHHSKEEKIEIICRDWGIHIKDAYYFTDAKADVFELKNFLTQEKIIGCPWGFLTKEELEEVLPREQVLENYEDIHRIFEKLHVSSGSLVHSDEFNGMDSEEAKEKIVAKVGGKMTSTYKMRDWSISRQRYWGVPIPIVYDPLGKPHAVPDEHLPWTLPNDVDVTPTGEPPLAKSKELRERTEQIFGKGWTPEVETMDTFVDSSWYFLRYTDPKNENAFASVDAQKEWLPIDLYFGGTEHTTMHLLYSRFIQKALFDMKLTPVSEPYNVRINRGLVLGPDGNKMSKSKGNVIDPDEQVVRLGADTVKMYLAFMGPYAQPSNYPWDMGGIVGLRRFLERVYTLDEKIVEKGSDDITRLAHQTVKKVTDDIAQFKFNTAISALMILLNAAEKAGLGKNEYEMFLKLLAPFAPHLAEELWETFGKKQSIHMETWPIADPTLVIDAMVSVSVQFNGKTRGIIVVPRDMTEAEATEAASKNVTIKRYLDNMTIKRVVWVKGRVLNFIGEPKQNA